MILIFLGSWRSTLIIAVSIPLSILSSVTVLGFLHETITVMTLGGLALVVGPSLGQTLFDAGRRRAGSDAAVASYRETTLTAFQQVEDNLAALRILEGEEGQQRDAVTSAQESLEIFINRYQGGVDNYLQVITAQTTALANERNEIDIQRRRMDASVLLIKALGGGWKVTDLPTPSSLRKG